MNPAGFQLRVWVSAHLLAVEGAKYSYSASRHGPTARPTIKQSPSAYAGRQHGFKSQQEAVRTGGRKNYRIPGSPNLIFWNWFCLRNKLSLSASRSIVCLKDPLKGTGWQDAVRYFHCFGSKTIQEWHLEFHWFKIICPSFSETMYLHQDNGI